MGDNEIEISLIGLNRRNRQQSCILVHHRLCGVNITLYSKSVCMLALYCGVSLPLTLWDFSSSLCFLLSACPVLSLFPCSCPSDWQAKSFTCVLTFRTFKVTFKKLLPFFIFMDFYQFSLKTWSLWCLGVITVRFLPKCYFFFLLNNIN